MTGHRLTAMLIIVGIVLALLATGSRPKASAAPPVNPQRVVSFPLPSELVDTGSPGGLLPASRTTPKVNVILPAGYDAHPGRRYPVLWLLHGANGGTENWFDANTHITTDMTGFPGIVVMPDGGVFGMYMNWWNGGIRGNPAWARYHLDVLRNAIENRFRIRPGRRWHAIAGISMGGQGALRYAAMLPGYFGTVAGFSAAVPDIRTVDATTGLGVAARIGRHNGLGYDAIFGPPDAPYAVGNNPRDLLPNLAHTRVYLSSGDGNNCPTDPVNTDSYPLDIVTEAVVHRQEIAFADAARRAGIDVTDRTTCGVHTFGVWTRAIAATRAWGLFGPVTENPADWTYRTIATSGTMWRFGFRFDRPPTQVATFIRRGVMLSGSGAGKVHLAGIDGCRLTLDLPFRMALPRGCP